MKKLMNLKNYKNFTKLNKITNITKLTAFMLSVIITLSLSGCSTQSKEVSVKDREGMDISVPQKIETIISLAPSTTQILIELGLEEKLVAVDKYSAPLLKEGNTLPEFDIMNPDAEQLANLDVDIIFATGMSKSEGDDPLKLLKDMGAVVTYIPTSASIEEIKNDILFVAQVTDTEKKGEAIVSDMVKEIEKYAAIGKTITTPKTVYFEIAAAPDMYSFGQGVFLDEIITLIGAKNILADEEGWIGVASEVVAAANPDVIITNVDYVENPVEEIINRPGFADVNAVIHQEVYAIDKNSSSYANHNIVKAIREIAEAVYPEEYKGEEK